MKKRPTREVELQRGSFEFLGILYFLTALIVVAAIIILIRPPICVETFGNIGSFIVGLSAFVGIPFLIATFWMQSEDLRKNSLERDFENRYKSIDVGLSYVQDGKGTFISRAAISRAISN